MINDELNSKQKIELAKILMEMLNEGDWLELFICTDCDNFTRNHTSFLQDVHWKNPSLKQGCIVAIQYILQNPDNLKIIWEFDNVANNISRKNKELYESIRCIVENDKQKIVPQPNIQTPHQLFYATINEAEKSLNNNEPENAIDRIHTAVHVHLQYLCNKENITFSNNEAITGLIAKLRNNYKSTHNVSNDNPIVKILMGAGSIFDGLNNLRNHHSMTHPQNTLLNKHDALLAINMARTLMGYLNEIF
ncbi:abortive infection family protein [Proteus terrae]|uniref:abortive infection family protein n=1 Tax=Proteus TaxID=583 RepID=UPI0020340382|nr:abortive infection family protein [Proteus sp. FZP2095]MCM2366229.1 abortive infection family protein [Proteus sp. FZP2095]